MAFVIFERGEAVWVTHCGQQWQAVVKNSFIREKDCSRWYKVRLANGYYIKVNANGVTWRDAPKEQ